MKTIHIQANTTKQNQKEVCLGNGYRNIFGSLREANYFLADTNRFLTKVLVVSNDTLIQLYHQYRSFWLVSINNKTGTKVHYFDMQRKIKEMLQAAEVSLDKFNFSNNGSNDCYFAFIDLKKAAMFMQQAAEDMETFNRKRNLTSAMYTCQMLKERCMLIMQRLAEYGQK